MARQQTHLKMIQGVINRLSTNSFLLKGWSVILISSLFALAARIENIFFIYLAYFPVIAFWILDAYFLHHERLFRRLFDKVRQMDEKEIDFSMDITDLKSDVESWPKTMMSFTLLIFHGIIFGAIFLVMLIILCNIYNGG